MKLRPTLVLRFVSCLLVLFLVTTGCTTVQTYPGPQLPLDKVAKIKVDCAPRTGDSFCLVERE